MLGELNRFLEGIEGHPWFGVVDMAFHLFILGHVIHHVWHAGHRHVLPRAKALGRRLWRRVEIACGACHLESFDQPSHVRVLEGTTEAVTR